MAILLACNSIDLTNLIIIKSKIIKSDQIEFAENSYNCRFILKLTRRI